MAPLGGDGRGADAVSVKVFVTLGTALAMAVLLVEAKEMVMLPVSLGVEVTATMQKKASPSHSVDKNVQCKKIDLQEAGVTICKNNTVNML